MSPNSMVDIAVVEIKVTLFPKRPSQGLDKPARPDTFCNARFAFTRILHHRACICKDGQHPAGGDTDWAFILTICKRTSKPLTMAVGLCGGIIRVNGGHYQGRTGECECANEGPRTLLSLFSTRELMIMTVEWIDSCCFGRSQRVADRQKRRRAVEPTA